MTLRTFEIAKLAHASKLRKEAERDPFVSSVLLMFPGAEIVSVNEVPHGRPSGAPEAVGGQLPSAASPRE